MGLKALRTGGEAAKIGGVGLQIIRDWVMRFRQKKGLTQEQLADISGFSQQYISGLERGHRNPTVVTVYELATALGASYLDLMRPPPRGKR
jgi:predicted transcriptional regulator